MIRFRDIMSDSIVYYDREYKDECAEFCKARRIQFLPAIHDTRVCFRYLAEANRFEQERISDRQCVHPDEYIFQPGMVPRFQEFEVQFVVDHGRLLGLVHYSDYSRPKVYEDIYKMLYKLERGLIYLIVENAGLTKKELFDFMKRRGRGKLEELVVRTDFSKNHFTLKSIMELTTHIELLRIRHIDRITLIRNKIAHSEDLVKKVSYKNEGLQYQFESFEMFWDGIQALQIAIKQVSNRLYFMKAITEENFEKKVADFEEYVVK